MKLMKNNSITIRNQITDQMKTILRQRKDNRLIARAWISFVTILRCFLNQEKRFLAKKKHYESKATRQKMARVLQMYILESMKCKAFNTRRKKLDWKYTYVYQHPNP